VYIQRRFHASRIPHRPYLHNYSCGETLGTGLSTMLVARPASYQTWSEMSSVWLPQVTNKSRMDTPSNHPGTAMVHLGECQIRKMLGSVS
jgi:hypothetical protein